MILLSILLLGSALSSPIYPQDLGQRQVVDVPASTSSNSSNGTAAVPISAVIAVSVILGIGILIALFFRRYTRKKHSRRAEGVHATISIPLTAEDLAGTSDTRTRATPSNTAGTGNGSGAGRRSRRSRGRALRRTESGRSVKTLPEYSKEAGDEELVLVRRRSGSMSDEYEDDIPEEQEDPEMTNAAVPITIRPASTRSLSVSRSRSQSPTGDLAEGIPLSTQSALAQGSEGQTMETLQSQRWGEAPTYLEAMSSHDPDAPLPALVPSPRPSALQRTATGFRELISKPFAPGSFRPTQHQRDRGPSTSSSLLHPTTSRFSTTSTSTEYPSPWASSHSLLISPPVPNSAMRASFDGSDIPRGGLNPAQMKFLSSKEAVELVGIKLEDVPAHKRRRSAQASSAVGTTRGSEIEVDTLPPPSWEQLDGERRQSEAFERRNLATPVPKAAASESNDSPGEAMAVTEGVKAGTVEDADIALTTEVLPIASADLVDEASEGEARDR